MIVFASYVVCCTHPHDKSALRQAVQGKGTSTEHKFPSLPMHHNVWGTRKVPERVRTTGCLQPGVVSCPARVLSLFSYSACLAGFFRLRLVVPSFITESSRE